MTKHEELIAEARRAADEEVGYDTGDGRLYLALADALESLPTPPVAGEPEREALARVLFISRESDHWGYDAHEIAEVCERVADAILAAGYRREPEPREVTTVDDWTDPKPWLYRNGSRTAHKLPQMHVARGPRTRAQYEDESLLVTPSTEETP